MGVLSELEQTDLVAACDLRPEVRQRVTARYPALRMVASVDDLLSDERIQAVVIATEARTHFALGSAALQAGKHVLCEKPLTTEVAEAVALAPPGMSAAVAVEAPG